MIERNLFDLKLGTFRYDICLAHYIRVTFVENKYNAWFVKEVNNIFNIKGADLNWLVQGGRPY